MTNSGFGRYTGPLAGMLGAVLLIATSSCMHLPMATSHDGMTGDAAGDPVMEKSIIQSGVEVMAVVPVMRPDEGNLVTIRVKLIDAAQPVTGADVSYHWMSVEGDARSHQHGEEEMSGNAMREGSAAEVSPGTYTFELSGLGAGRYSLTVKVAAGELQGPVVFDVERNVAMQHAGGGGMMGMGSSPTSWIVGGILMATVMLVMMTAR